MRAFFATALCALALGGRTPAQAPGPASGPAVATEEGPQSFARELSAADRIACTARGGRVERRGRIGAEHCVIPFPDAGKTCADKADCQGKCIGTVEQSAATTDVMGQCQADDVLFGCYSELLGGKAVNAICVD